MHREKPMYKKIYEFVENWVAVHGSSRGAFVAAARVFYPDDPPDRALKKVYELYRYARRRIWSSDFGVFGEDFGDRIAGDAAYNMQYYLGNHSGPIKRNTFAEESRANRQLFELKKLAYAVLQGLIKPRPTLSNYIEKTFKDPRVTAIAKQLPRTWYNGKNYIKISKRAAALLYLITHKIYVQHYGAGNKPQKLIKRFHEITGYGPSDLRRELRELAAVFYDWLLFLD